MNKYKPIYLLLILLAVVAALSSCGSSKQVVYFQDLKPGETEIKLPEIITVAPTVEIRKVAKVMIDFKLDAIPVVDENDILVGIVSKTDILKAISYLPKMQLWS